MNSSGPRPVVAGFIRGCPWNVVTPYKVPCALLRGRNMHEESSLLIIQTIAFGSSHMLNHPRAAALTLFGVGSTAMEAEE